MNISSFYYREEYMINNIFKINPFILNLQNDKKKVRFDNIVEVMIIPSRIDYMNDKIINDIWYTIHELKIMKIAFRNELNVISHLKHINLNEALSQWKDDYSSFTYTFEEVVVSSSVVC